MEIDAIRLLSGALALLPMFGVAIALGMIFSSYNEAVGRNPGAANELDKKFFITVAFTEALAMIAFVMSVLILFKVAVPDVAKTVDATAPAAISQPAQTH